MTPAVPEILGGPRVARLSHLLRTLWAKGLARPPDLARLYPLAKQVAAEEGGGRPMWHEPFERLLASLQSEAQLNPIGLTFAYVQIEGILRRRARAVRLWRAHPDIAQVPVPRPIVVLGQMRSGTTRVQRLLACDPRLSHTRLFEMLEPVPRLLEPRALKARAQLAMLGALNPAIDAIHPSGARAVDEPLPLLTFSFYGAQLDAQWWVPSFTRWWEGQDRRWVYGEFAQLLRTVLWRRRASADAPLVLKVPQFMEDLDPLLTVFPDARLICLSRPREAVVASAASLAWNQMRVQSDAADPRAIGAEWAHRTDRRAALAAKGRTAHPHVPHIDITFDDMNDDWRGQMRRIYAFLGLDLPVSLEARMARYLRDAERSGYRGHQYRAEDFGLKPTTGFPAAEAVT